MTMLIAQLTKTEAVAAVTSSAHSAVIDTKNSCNTISVQIVPALHTTGTGSAVLEASNDGVAFATVATITDITAAAVLLAKDAEVAFRFYRLTFTVTAGSVDFANTWLGLGSAA
jgi:hypothetical protein